MMLFKLSMAYSQGGGVKLNEAEAINGYVLLKNYDLSTYHLINNCGEIVNTWNIADGFYNHGKLLPNGNLLFFNGNKIEERSWDDQVVNSVFLISNDIALDYEVIKMNNGNYLSVGRKEKSAQEFINLGFSLDGQAPSVVDVVMEIDSTSGRILWEWDISDHIIQERDPSKGNYGVVADHPELLDVDAISDFDWQFYESFMINGMDFNEELEQIALSIRKLSEVIIIDKSTTTEEAATGEGGNSGKGGDILFRWGNPQNYGQGNSSDRKLYFQHNPKWARVGPYEGKLTAFNNGLDRPFSGAFFSEIPVVDTEVDENGNYALDENEEFASGSADFIYRSSSNVDGFYSGYLSGGQLLSNGNVFVTVGEQSTLKEYNEDGELLWEFRYGWNDAPFRTEKYSEDYPAFIGRDLTPDGYTQFSTPFDGCELNPTSLDDLDSFLSSIDLKEINPGTYNLLNPEYLNLEIHLLHGSGISLLRSNTSQDVFEFILNDFMPGMYILSIKDVESGKTKNFKLVITN